MIATSASWARSYATDRVVPPRRSCQGAGIGAQYLGGVREGGEGVCPVLAASIQFVVPYAGRHQRITASVDQ